LSRWWAQLTRTFDPRFDAYGRVFAKVIAGRIDRWTRPTAAAVTVPIAMQDVPSLTVPLAGVEIPSTDEHWADVSEVNALAQQMAGSLTPFPDTASECGDWSDGEDRIAELRAQLQRWPAHRSLVPWGDDRFSDGALTDLVFGGVGQHRLQRLGCEGCPTRPAQVSSEARFAVLLNFAASLDVRPGFAKLGADAYFDSAGRILAIVRAGKAWTPSSPLGTEPICTGFLYWRRCTANVGWQHAKLAFRGTLMAVVTFVDHLYSLHFTLGNALVTANVEEVPPAHPLRRLLTPFGFRTEAINLQAASALVPEGQLVHRASPLSTRGIGQVFDHARQQSERVAWATVRQRHWLGGTVDPSPTAPLPFVEDGDDYFGAVKTFVHGYLEHHFSGDTCAADEHVANWYARVNSLMPRRDLPALTCAALEEVVATFVWYVSAMHNHVGTIAAEVEDPCFAPWAWREGELCGPPRSFFIQAITMMATSLEQPRIMEDYTHLFDDDASKGLWRGFTEGLRQVGARVAQRNAGPGRRRPFLSFATDRIETAVSI